RTRPSQWTCIKQWKVLPLRSSPLSRPRKAVPSSKFQAFGALPPINRSEPPKGTGRDDYTKGSRYIVGGERLALLGGEKAVVTDPGDIFDWPIITKEHEEAVLAVLRRGAMSGR